jgi:hypothetical protein
MGRAAAVMDFAEAGTTMPSGRKLEIAPALFDLVDLTTSGFGLCPTAPWPAMS